MTSENVLKPAGLFTDPNPISAVPPGALREALNVVIRRDGIVEPRPGFKKTLLVDGEGDPSVTSIARLVPWRDSTLVYQNDGTAAFYQNDFGGTQQSDPYQLTGAVGTDFVARAVETRGNLYACAADGVRKYTSETDDVPALAGVFGSGMVVLTDGVSFTDASWGYRAVLVHRDENAVVVKSEPSPLTVALGSTGVPNVTIYVTLTSDVALNDEIEIYRTVESSSQFPGDECFLLKTLTVSSTNVTNGYIETTDDEDDENLGAALYTNASREGILQANTPPPKVYDLALFRGSLFGARVKSPDSASVSWVDGGNENGNATGIGRRTTTGNTTSGNTGLTALVSTTGWAVGMLIYGTGIPNGTRITALGAGTATLSAAATATNAGVTFTVVDTIQLGSEYFAMADPDPGAANITGAYVLTMAVNTGRRVTSTRWLSSTGAASANYRARLLSESVPPVSGTGIYKVGLYALDPSDVFGGVNATKPTETLPPVSAIGTSHSANAAYVDDNLTINGLIYSKADQPEAMPYPANMERVGSSSHAIDRILATKDALWIFKRDGIFRLTGAGAASGWRIDPFDMTTYLIGIDSAVVMDDAIYAWTNRGVVRVSDGGVSQISALSIATDLRESELYGMRVATDDSEPFGSPTSSVMAAGWAIANTKDDEYIVCIPADLSIGEGVAYTPTPYVYNTKTLAWTRWSMRHDLAAGAVAGDGRILFGGLDENDDGALSVERSPLNTADAPLTADWEWEADIAVTSTIDSLGDGYFRVRFSPAITGYVSTLGDVLLYREAGVPTWSNYDAMAVITARASNSDFTVYSTNLSTTASYYGQIFEAHSGQVEFVAKIGGQPGAEKAWTTGTVVWGSTRLLDRYAMSFTSSLIESAEETTLRTDGWPDNDADVPQVARFWVPRNHSRSGMLYPEIVIAHAGSAWQVYGITLANLAAYPRVRR